LPATVDVSKVDLPGRAGEIVIEQIGRLAEVSLAEERIVEYQLDPPDPNEDFAVVARRFRDHIDDSMFVGRERAIAGNLTNEQLDMMVMSFTDVIAFDAAKRDPRAPPFVRSAVIEARRRELDARLVKIRKRRALGLPDEEQRPAIDDPAADELTMPGQGYRAPRAHAGMKGP